MKQQIFPKEIIESTFEVHQFKHSNKSKIIYSIFLIALISVIVALPFIKVAIYNTSQGLIRPDKERILLQNSISGKVVYHNLKNNLKVTKGDTLLYMNNSAITQKIKNTNALLEEVFNFCKDLEMLLASRKSVTKLITSKYQQQYSFYKQRINELNTRYKKINDDYKRNQKLFEKGVIAKVNLIESKLTYDLALNAINQFKKQQNSTWENELVDYQNQLKELKNNEAQLKENNNLSILKAPVSGTLINVKGIEKGSFIQGGLELAEISPKSDLIVECFISPIDIGLLKNKSTVNFQVSAFNYNQWGLASGKVLEIGNDIQMVNNTPMFRVLCSLNQEFLELKNGFRGQLKKGMLVNARFELTERALFDLLYDKVDDWVNPSTQIAEK